MLKKLSLFFPKCSRTQKFTFSLGKKSVTIWVIVTILGGLIMSVDSMGSQDKTGLINSFF